MESRLTGWSLGIICILVVALIWSASSVLVQAIFKDGDFARPFFMTWVANSLFMITLLFRCCTSHFQQPLLGPPVEVKKAARAGAIVAPVWFAANATYNYSMGMTSITSTTVISSSSAAFTLMLSAVWIGEPITTLKVLGVLLCALGNIFTAISDHSPDAAAAWRCSNGTTGDEGQSPTFSGDLVCVISAALYALYTVLIRKLQPPDLALFFGFLGFVTFILFGPFVFILHATGIESLSSITPAITALILSKGLFDNVLSDYLWAKAVLLTSPSVATIGMSLTVPLAVVSDMLLPCRWLIDAAAPTGLSALAAISVVSGFVVINLASDGSNSRCNRPCWRASLRRPLLHTQAESEPANEASDTQGFDVVVPRGLAATESD